MYSVCGGYRVTGARAGGVHLLSNLSGLSIKNRMLLGQGRSTSHGKMQVPLSVSQLGGRRLYSGNNDQAQTTTGTSTDSSTASTEVSWFKRWLYKDITADKYFNRYRLLPAAIMTHLCLGSCYAWSVINEPLIHSLGVVASSSADWSLGMIAPVFSMMFVMQGLSAALVGKWQEKAGPRASGILGSLCFGGGFMMGGLGVLLHQHWMLLLGYGFFGGLGMGLAYVPPMANLIRWFPDRRGLATGLILMGFGGGAGITIPIMQYLLKHFQKAPQYLGPVDAVEMITREGKRFVEIGNELKEVVIASTSDLVNMPGLLEGVYVVGTGSTGAGQTLICLGLGFLATMFAFSLSHRTPPPGYIPSGWMPPISNTGMISTRNVHVDTVIKTPQFWFMWTTFGTLAASGMALLFVAKTMMSDIFATALPMVVTSSFAAAYVMSMSMANLGGRLFWASLSDYIGRKNVFITFFALNIPLFLATPYLISWVSTNPNVLPLALFYGSTMIIISIFGAAYSCMPAYEADLFGTKFCGAVHGRMLTASALASAAGPTTLTILRSKSEKSAIWDLAEKVDPDVFYQRFGATLQNLDDLIEAKTVTIKNLLELLPLETMDPTPFLYNTTLYTTAGALLIGAFANFAIQPIDKKHFLDEEPTAISSTTNVETKATEPAPISDGTGDVWVVGLDATTLAEDVFLWLEKTIDKKKDRAILVAISPNSALASQEHQANDDTRAITTLSKYLKRATESSIPVEVVLGESTNIGEALTTVAKIKKATHLVLGGSAKRGLKTMGIGSVAKYCTSHAPCTVTLVRVPHETESPKLEDIKPIDWEPIQDPAIHNLSLHLWKMKKHDTETK